MNKQLVYFAVVLFFIISIGLPSRADAPSGGSTAPISVVKAQPHYTYLTGQEEAWKEFPKAPALGSPIDEDDLLIALSAQAARTDAQKQEALTDQHWSIQLISGVIAPDFETKYPATFAVLKNAAMDAGLINKKLKDVNRRLRPFVQHPTLVTPLFPVDDFTYPSGHASGSEVQARLLGLLFPDHAEDLLKRARQVADGRVIAGVHYASDTEAGENLGDLIFFHLESSAKFKQDLADAAQKDGIPFK